MAKKAKEAAPKTRTAPRATRSVAVKAPASIYTMLLFLSALALLLGCIFLFLEMKAYNMQISVPPDARGSWQPAISAHADMQLV